jgi:hypothetical protein
VAVVEAMVEAVRVEEEVVTPARMVIRLGPTPRPHMDIPRLPQPIEAVVEVRVEVKAARMMAPKTIRRLPASSVGVKAPTINLPVVEEASPDNPQVQEHLKPPNLKLLAGLKLQ